MRDDPPGSSLRHARWARRHPVLTGSGVVLVLLVALGAVEADRPPPAAAPPPASALARPATSVASPSPTVGVTPVGAVVATLAPTTATVAVLSPAERAIRAAEPRTALAALAALPVRGRAPRTGYDRAAFGPAWADVDRNGCDTRNDVLRRDLTGVVLRDRTNGCLVLRGTLRDPYTGSSVAFTRGAGSAAVQIDHVVALSDAWQKGARAWSSAQREAFANDSLNLLAVDGATNARKGDGDAATWLPPAKGYRCAYVARQVSVKQRYGLWATRAEREASGRVLAGCARQPTTVPVAFRLGGGTVEPAPRLPPRPATGPTATPAPRPGPDAGGGADDEVSYASCAAVRAAGAAPIRAQDPGFEPRFDRDEDGVGCE